MSPRGESKGLIIDSQIPTVIATLVPSRPEPDWGYRSIRPVRESQNMGGPFATTQIIAMVTSFFFSLSLSL